MKKPAKPVAIEKKKAAVDMTPRDRAKKYIAWLNRFCEVHDYQIITEDNRLVLERSDRIE